MASHRSRRNQSRSGAATNSDLDGRRVGQAETDDCRDGVAAHRSTRRWLVHAPPAERGWPDWNGGLPPRSEEHTSELQSHSDLVCRLLLEKKKQVRGWLTAAGGRDRYSDRARHGLRP